MSLVIATYYWHPDAGSKFAHPYTVDDVIKLQRMVAKHCTVPHQFAVITDRPELFTHSEQIRAIPLDKATHVPGTCFVRLMTFSPWGKELFGERMLQLDLDTMIVGNIEHLVNRQEELVLWRNPALHPLRPGRALYNTSILLHRCGTLAEVWETFLGLNDEQRRRFKDDQWFLSEVFGKDCPYFDGARDGVYRRARKDTPGSGVDGELPANACVVTFPGSHGKLDAEYIKRNPWVLEHSL